MTRDEYVDLLADFLSGVPERVSAANQRMFEDLVDSNEQPADHPSLALVDAEQRLQG